jgi:protein gp37
MTKIQWTDETANWIVGCSKVSAGCRSCYAATAASSARLQQFDQYKTVVDGNGNWNGNIEFVPKVLDDLLKGKRSRRVFTPSMSDPFHPNVRDEWLDQFMATVALTPHITYQCLTKRSRQMMEYLKTAKIFIRDTAVDIGRLKNIEHTAIESCQWDWPLPNLHPGASVENQAAADERIPWLIKTPAEVRFLSMEPLIEPVFLGRQNLKHIDWVIVGGESGKNARKLELNWVRAIQDECFDLGVKYFFKQAGSNVWDGGRQLKLRDRKGGDLSELPEDLRIREVI